MRERETEKTARANTYYSSRRREILHTRNSRGRRNDDEENAQHASTKARSKEGGEKNYRFFLSFFSFFRVFLYEFRSVKGRRGSAKSDDERNNLRLRRLSLSRVYILSLLWSRGGNGKGSSTGESSLVFDRCIPRTTLIVVVTAKRVPRTHKTYILKCN